MVVGGRNVAGDPFGDLVLRQIHRGLPANVGDLLNDEIVGDRVAEDDLSLVADRLDVLDRRHDRSWRKSPPTVFPKAIWPPSPVIVTPLMLVPPDGADGLAASRRGVVSVLIEDGTGT
jgi:hypothetical protein